MKDKLFSTYISLFKAGTRVGCHQREDRSFFIKGWQFPVCARCTGVFIGQISMIILALASVRPHLLWGLLFLFIMFIDWVLQYLKILESTNIRRLISGFIAGLGIIIVYINILFFIIKIFI